MDKGRSKFTSGGSRRQGTEVHEDRRTRRRRTRTDEERAEIEEQTLWNIFWNASEETEPALRRRRR